MYFKNQKTWLNTVLWKRLPERVKQLVLAFIFCAGSEDGILHCRHEDLKWLAKEKELDWALSWLVTADLAHYCGRYYLNPTLGHENLQVAKSSLFEKWAALTSIPF